MRNFVRARQGVATRIFPHQGNEDFLKGASALQAAPSAMLPAGPALAGGQVAVAYGPVNITASGAAPMFFLTAGGALPPGLVLSSAGVLSGTPTAAGAYAFTVRAQNRAGMVQTDYTLTVIP